MQYKTAPVPYLWGLHSLDTLLYVLRNTFLTHFYIIEHTINVFAFNVTPTTDLRLSGQFK